MSKYISLLQAIPCFAGLSVQQREELLQLMQEVRYAAREKIVNEGELVDSVYIMVSGKAEVTHEVTKHPKKTAIPVALLNQGDSIGLNETGFFSSTGTRTATVTALSDVLALQLNVKALNQFLQEHHLESALYLASSQMLRMQLIKQSLPFSHLSYERLQWLTQHVEDITVDAGTVLFRQGEQGDRCYLIYSGQIEIIAENAQGATRQLALLKPPVLFGEATLITHAPRNATAIALEKSELLVLHHHYLQELLETEDAVAKMFVNLMVDRSRPLHNPHITVHHRVTVDKQEITILKNPDNDSYFQLSREGWHIWEQLNGEFTLQEITLNMAEKFNLFAPDVVAALISKLNEAGFINNLKINDMMYRDGQSFLARAMQKIRSILEIRFAISGADKWISIFYDKGAYLLFTRIGQLALALLAVTGLYAIIFTAGDMLEFFASSKTTFTLLFGLIPLSLLTSVFHELGHALAVKASGRDVRYIGVGWYWFGPIAFTDTSDMWLTTRGPRTVVNLAGVYANALIAGVAALLVLAISQPYLQAMLWLFAVYTYLSAFRMLSPLQELDGYYVLMDWLDKPRLRQAAVSWLVKKFPEEIFHPRLLRQHLPEISYWVACLVFLFLVSMITLYVQDFIFKAIGFHPPHHYLGLIIPFLVVIFSSLNVIAEIRKVEE